MEISWTHRVKNEILQRVKEERESYIQTTKEG
jgi:hypothetical protein